ncbi:CU044_5270 family protein [Streptomyces sp. NPDC057638]|uniref:CU044_5270 family protein n=1 Tax=Streptomyces sp. NPDC057638 TaxID=3346190 RepID=UPI0036AF6B0C
MTTNPPHGNRSHQDRPDTRPPGSPAHHVQHDENRNEPGAAERQELAGLLPTPAVPDLEPDRALLLRQDLLRAAAPAGESGARRREGSALAPRPARLPAARPRRRVTRILVPALACALAVGTVVVLDRTDSPAPEAPPVAGGPSGTSEAARLLDRIALVAAARKSPPVRADQFVYVKSKVAFAGQSAAGGPLTLAPPQVREVWLSADGSRPGLVREGDGPGRTTDSPAHTVGGTEDGVATPSPGPTGAGRGSIDNPTHQYVASLPTDPDALLRLIQNETRGKGDDPHHQVFTVIGTLLAETWAPPRVSAALYQAAARIPGVTVVPAATDAAGRDGVAVARAAQGRQTQWIFDRTSSVFLGERTVLTETTDAGTAGEVTGSSAILTKAAVDRPGQAPGN